MTTLDELTDYIASAGVTHLVLYEFTGAVLTPLLTEHIAMSVDWREPLHSGPHYQGNVADVVPLKVWTFVLCVGPPCYQHLRHDPMLKYKIADGRAYWGGAEVLWCLLAIRALAVAAAAVPSWPTSCE